MQYSVVTTHDGRSIEMVITAGLNTFIGLISHEQACAQTFTTIRRNRRSVMHENEKTAEEVFVQCSTSLFSKT